MKLDRIEDRNIQTFVHQPVASANAPQRRSAHHVGRTLPGILNNAIASADVVQGKVTERVNDLVAERRRDRERSTIDERGSTRSGLLVPAGTAILRECASHSPQRSRCGPMPWRAAARQEPRMGSACRVDPLRAGARATLAD